MKRLIHLSKNQINDIALIVGFIILYALFYYFVSLSNTGSDGNSRQLQPAQLELEKNATSPGNLEIPTTIPTTSTTPTTTPNTTTAVSTPVIIPKNYSVKMDGRNGFYPDSIEINKSDTITWNNGEIQRTRIVLISKEGLFGNQLMLYTDRYQYQFNQQGNYTFKIAYYPSNQEFENVTGTVVVK